MDLRYMGQGREEAVAEVKALEANRRFELLAVAGPLVQSIGYLFEPTEDAGTRISRILDLKHDQLTPESEQFMKPRIEDRNRRYLMKLKEMMEGKPNAPFEEHGGCMCS